MAIDPLLRERAAVFIEDAPGEDQQLFGIFDLARDARLQPTLLRHPVDVTCLEAGPLEAKVRAKAPYLARAGRNSRLLPDLVRAGWGDSWGMFGACPSGLALELLRRHFFGLLRVTLPDERRVVFRFYDPRVLRTFLPTCDRDQLREFFGPVTDLWVEDSDPNVLLHFRFDGEKLQREAIPLG